MRDQILVMDRLLNRTGHGYIYCLKVVIQLPPMLFVQLSQLQLDREGTEKSGTV